IFISYLFPIYGANLCWNHMAQNLCWNQAISLVEDMVKNGVASMNIGSIMLFSTTWFHHTINLSDCDDPPRFNNGVLRLCDMKFSDVGFDDVFLSWSCGYDYPQEPISDEIIDIFETWLDKYARAANETVDMKADIKTMIVETLCDKNSKERAFFLMGEGGNGKSVLCNLLCNLLGEYAVNVPFETLTKSIEAEGKNPFIKRMRYKR
ncbi:hypothetical protein AURANDRAFT_69397, partial [Aureococcus anophagefferens]